jgi:phosphodiesterase/alkaline phosphatase D-like protein
MQTATVRWRTDRPSSSKLAIGTALGEYTRSVVDSQLTTEHSVTVNGLSSNTRYYYQIGSADVELQDGKLNYFTTAPPASISEKIRIAVFGDAGRNRFGVQRRVLEAYQIYTNKQPADVLLLLGDNAYHQGTDREYQKKFFKPYGSSILKNHALFPIPGNHDYGSRSRAARTHAYYKNFTMPAAGELGGVPSGTEAYYSYNWGNIHFVSMDSHGTEDGGTTRMYDTLGAQITWLKKDLAANNQQWTIVYWHHPPYTMGGHNSDTEGELFRIRTNVLPILERYGVDLLLSGHSHNYERSYLQRGYYGKEAAFQPAQHTVSASTGAYDQSPNSCPYLKDGQADQGIVYVVSGSAGARDRVEKGYPHNALPFSFNKGGLFYLEVEGNRLDGKFIGSNAKVWDQFTIMKGVQKKTNLSIAAGTPVTLTASWIGNYNWPVGETGRSITVTPTADSTYSVTDGAGCLSDTFTITIQR